MPAHRSNPFHCIRNWCYPWALTGYWFHGWVTQVGYLTHHIVSYSFYWSISFSSSYRPQLLYTTWPVMGGMLWIGQSSYVRVLTHLTPWELRAVIIFKCTTHVQLSLLRILDGILVDWNPNGRALDLIPHSN